MFVVELTNYFDNKIRGSRHVNITLIKINYLLRFKIDFWPKVPLANYLSRLHLVMSSNIIFAGVGFAT
jgi:hypothetical protein